MTRTMSVSAVPVTIGNAGMVAGCIAAVSAGRDPVRRRFHLGVRQRGRRGFPAREEREGAVLRRVARQKGLTGCAGSPAPSGGLVPPS